jgi:SSS family solute:Na+ symporter
MVILGVLGHIDFPELAGPATNNILIMQIAEHAPGVLAGLLGAGVFAAIMSSLDSQSLSLGAMFTEDVVRHYRLIPAEELDGGRDVVVSRVFIALVIGVTFVLSLVAQRSIFGLAVWSFSGFAALLPILLAALYWRRATAAGAIASLLTVISLWLYFFRKGFAHPDYSVLGLDIMPVAVIFTAGAVVLIVVSLMTRPPSQATVDRFVAGG